MTWLKRNLILVVGGVVALAFLGGAVFFLFTSKRQVDDVTGQLTAQTDELKRLVTRDPHPNPDNIEAAKKEQGRLTDFLGQSRRFFAPVANFSKLDSADFKRLLETTIVDLERGAEEAGVNLPSRYNFTFSPQRNRVDFAPDTLMQLATQVAEIKALCDVLFGARIHALVSLRRVPVGKEDEGATDYLMGKKAATNTVASAIVSPYEVTFQGFSSELAAVLEGLYRSSNCFVVKNIDVQTNIVVAVPGADMTATPFIPSFLTPSATTPRPSMSPSDLMRRRYGIDPAQRYRTEGPTPATPPPPVGVPAAQVRRGPETVLDERPFKVTMFVEAVRMVEPAAK